MNSVKDWFGSDESVCENYCDDCNKSLQKLEKCFIGVKESSSITSYNFALIHLWLELTSTLMRFKKLQNKYYKDVLSVYFNTIDFKAWGIKVRRFCNNLPDHAPDDTVDLRFEIEEGVLYPKNSDADEYIFNRFEDYIRYGNMSMDDELRKEIESQSNTFLPKIMDLRQVMGTSQLKQAVCSFLLFLSDLLMKIERDYNHPDYNAFEKLCKIFLLEYNAFCYSNNHLLYPIPSNISIDMPKSELMDNINDIHDKLVSSGNCSEEQWDQLFEQDSCAPNNGIVGELIFNQRKKEDRIQRAFDIIYNVNLCVLYKAAYSGQASLQMIKDRIAQEKNIGIPEELRNIMFIDDEAFEKFKEIVIIEMPKYTDSQKSNWDILCYLCQYHRIIKPRMRTKFSELLVAISPNLGPAQALCSNMEKCTVTPSRTMDDEKGYKKVLKDPVGQEIDKLLQQLTNKNSE